MRTIHKKSKKYFGHVECSFGKAAKNFSQRSGQLSLKVQKLSKIWENMILILNVVHWTRRKQFWQLSWKLFAGSSRHFASKSKLNLKTKNCFWKKFPQTFLRRLEWNVDKTDKTFFSELRFLSLELEVKWNMTNYCEKNREVLCTRRMQFGKCCWNFSPEVWTIIAQSPKTFESFRKYDNRSQSGPLDT